MTPVSARRELRACAYWRSRMQTASGRERYLLCRAFLRAQQYTLLRQHLVRCMWRAFRSQRLTGDLMDRLHAGIEQAGHDRDLSLLEAARVLRRLGGGEPPWVREVIAIEGGRP